MEYPATVLKDTGKRGFVTVKTMAGKEVQLPLGGNTLDAFRREVSEKLFGSSDTSGTRLVWMGKTVEPADETCTMRSHDPGCRDGEPAIWAMPVLPEAPAAAPQPQGASAAATSPAAEPTRRSSLDAKLKAAAAQRDAGRNPSATGT